MNFASRLTRSPRPFRPERGQEAAALFPDFPPELLELIAGAAGCSPYLAGLLTREQDWIAQLVEQTPEALRFAELARLGQLTLDELETGLRVAKRRLALLAGLADLGGVWPLEEVTETLTLLADTACDRAVYLLVAAEIARGKLPGLGAADAETAGGMSLLAMGKMGAGELNYSSDIDLICLFDETRFDPADYMEARSAFVRVTRRLTKLLSENTGEGYVFRTDLRLRPDASVTPVCIAMETAERYYESVGRTWERAAFIKARACAGDIAAGERFLQRLTPFVWRKHLDFAAIEDAHDMRLRIREHKGLGGPVTLEGHDMKLGRGGIREIEFFTQTRQIIAGGRDPSLRVRGTVDGLDRLAEAGWVAPDLRDDLQASYRAHREVEHRLQMIADAQTHALPGSEDGFARLAAFMDCDVAELRATLEVRLARTHAQTDAFFAPDAPQEAAPQDAAQAYLEQWRGLPALRSPRAVEIFRRVFPGMLASFQGAARPEEALSSFESFLRGLPAGVQVFSLFEANPQLTGLIVDICTASPELASYLARNSSVLDAVIDGGFFEDWPGVDALSAGLAQVLQGAGDYEAQLDAARRWQKDWVFRIGVHHLRGLISADVAAAEYSDLAEATLCALFPVIQAEFARKHGAPPGRGAAILAMGSLGARRLNATSDLDLIVIYDPADAESSDGPRPLMTRIYFARLTQALITALTAPMAQGRLYEVDMRLRPSGQSGPVATTLAAFEDYQRNEAWFWEHMALTRARPMGGQMDLVADIEAVRCAVIASGQAPQRAAAELSDMRRRLAEAGRMGSTWEVKPGAGGLQDLELFAQGVALVVGADIPRGPEAQLAHVAQEGWLSAEALAALQDGLAAFSALIQGARLLSRGALEPERIGAGGEALICRDLQVADMDAAAQLLEKCRKQVKSVVEHALARLGKGAKAG